MAAPSLGRSPTCLNCLRQLSRPAPMRMPIASPVSSIQIRSRTTKAELEDLQGIPVRLTKDIIGFGRKHAIIRVKPGRMRNFWFPKGQAEYMTRNRFKELGLTDAAVGVRDRTFGSKIMVDEEKKEARKKVVVEEPVSQKKKETLTLPPEETLSLLTTILPPTLTIARKPIAVPTPAAAPPEPPVPQQPAMPRSPSLAANASISRPDGSSEPEAPAAAPEPAPGPVAIFGSVSTGDILHVIKEALTVDSQGGRVALEEESIKIFGLEEGEDRIKRLGTFKVEILAGKGLEPVIRTVEVVSDQ
ncbi:hypothetical protein SLS62_002446 [Diatrype stigma]|uniref:Ribosomal protein L9 domain-containing protein n=1 Tax=Diatrype stigma TaxID=117547 RepID=A0AAN9UU31_9PEZI